MNLERTKSYWFKGEGVISEFDCENLFEKEFETRITKSDNIRSIQVNKSCNTLISLEIDFHTINLFDLEKDEIICEANFELQNFEMEKCNFFSFFHFFFNFFKLLYLFFLKWRTQNVLLFVFQSMENMSLWEVKLVN